MYYSLSWCTQNLFKLSIHSALDWILHLPGLGSHRSASTSLTFLSFHNWLLDCVLSCFLPVPHDCWERVYFEVCKVHKQKKMPFGARSLQTAQQELAPSWTTSVSKLLLAVHFKCGAMSFAWLQSQIIPGVCHGLEVNAMCPYNFCFLWEAPEWKAENKMLTANTKQCLPSAKNSLYACRDTLGNMQWHYQMWQ